MTRRRHSRQLVLVTLLAAASVLGPAAARAQDTSRAPSTSSSNDGRTTSDGTRSLSVSQAAGLDPEGQTISHADRVAMVCEGRLVADGPPGDVLTGERLTEVYRHPVEVLAHPRTGDLLVAPIRSSVTI